MTGSTVFPQQSSETEAYSRRWRAKSNDDLTERTVPFKKDISFSDGSSFGPEDVVATYKATIDSRFASTETTAVESIDDVTADGNPVVTSTSNTLILSSTVASSSYRISEAFNVTSLVGTEDMKINSTPIGTGPYKVTSLRPPEAIFEARDGYWSDTPETKKIVIRHNTDDTPAPSTCASAKTTAPCSKPSWPR